MPPRRRPPLRRPLPGPRPGRSVAHQLLKQAHHQMETGDYLQAANTFQKLAEGAERRGLLRQAPRLFLQAGKAALLSGQEERGREHIKHALKSLAEHHMWGILSSSGRRTVQELRQQGYASYAGEVENWLEKTIPDDFETSRTFQAPGIRLPPLPTKCPSCGGPILSDEVDWADPQTALCPYCGSGVRRER